MTLLLLLALFFQPPGPAMERQWQQELVATPGAFAPAFNLGFYYFNANRLAEAEPLLRRAAQANPADFNTHYILGVVCQRQSRREDALRRWRAALALPPHHLRLMKVMSVEYTEGRYFAEAAALARRVLAGASVEVNGQPIPLFFVSAGQINAQMPFGLSGAVSVRVRTAAGLSPAVSLPLAPAAPRLFTRSMDGKGDPILVRATDWTMVTAPAPAQPGDYLILFLTGLGNVSPAISAGTPAGDNAANGPLNQLPAGAVTVTFGGKDAPVLFAGLAPGFVGLYQINFQVPAAPSGSSIIVATRAAASSDPTALPAPTRVTVSAAAEQTVGARRFGSSSQLALAWTAPSYPVDHYQITAAESLQGTTVSATARSLSATLTGLKAATPYAITVKACADAPCRQSGAASPVTGSTATEYWQLRGAGNTTAGLTRIVRNGNVRISATRFGPEAGPVTANRSQLYYGPMPPPNAALITALTPSAANAADPASYLSFTNPGATTGLLTPSSP
ncbi:MAG: fibronectin type III domain-containing protein, partial [Acidobacteriota bacterium]